MRKLFLLFVLSLLLVTVAFAQTTPHKMSFLWNPVIGATGYKAHWGTAASRTYSGHVDLGNVTTGEVLNLPEGTQIYIALTSYNSAGESSYSREVVGWPKPIVSSIPTNCTPIAAGGVTCQSFIAGYNFSPGITAEIPYTGVAITGTTRVDSHSLQVNFTIDAAAQGGSANLILRNPWTVTAGTELPGETAPTSGLAGVTFPGAVTVTPVVLPAAPSNLVNIGD